MFERRYAPGFHDLIFGILATPGRSKCLRDSGTDANAHISRRFRDGYSILPSSAVKHSGASVVACQILDQIPMCGNWFHCQ